jgi:hypothetical protein
LEHLEHLAHQKGLAIERVEFFQGDVDEEGVRITLTYGHRKIFTRGYTFKVCQMFQMFQNRPRPLKTLALFFGTLTDWCAKIRSNVPKMFPVGLFAHYFYALLYIFLVECIFFYSELDKSTNQPARAGAAGIMPALPALNVGLQGEKRLHPVSTAGAATLLVW